MRDTALIACLCKDIARHASQLEAECQGVKQSTERYFELKSLLLTYFLQGGDFEIILNEIRKSWKDAGGWDDKGELTVSTKNHALCMLDFFMMLFNEINKEEN